MHSTVIAPTWSMFCKAMASLCTVLFCGSVLAMATAQVTVTDMPALVARCAASVHPETMTAVIAAESKGHQFAIADAGPVKLPWAQRKLMVRSYFENSVEEATARANDLLANGHTVSLGLTQINDRNLVALGLTVREVFDPCTNVAAGAKILTDFYRRASTTFGGGERALRAAISAYNSGDWLRGEADGYVDTVYRMAGRSVPLRTALVVPRLAGRASERRNVADARALVERRFTMSVTRFPGAQ